MRWGLLVTLAACHARLADPAAPETDAPPQPIDDGGTPIADDGALPDAMVMLGPWGTPTKIPIASSTANFEDDSTMSWSGTELVWAVQINGAGNKSLYTASYTNNTFGAATLLPFSGVDEDESPRFSTDDLTLYFGSTRGGASLDIYSAHRTAVGMPWKTPVVVAGPNTGKTDKWYAPCGGNQYLVVGTTAAGDTDIYEGIVGAAPVAVAAVNSPQNDTSVFMTEDCLTMYFASARGASTDLYTSHRATVNTAWAAPSLFAPFNTTDNEEDPWISPDQRTFVFARSAAGAQKDLYISTR